MARPYRTAEDDRDVFRALAHPVRRQIVAACVEQRRSFDELRQVARRTGPALAAHLRILREARVLAATRSGRSVSYHVIRQALRSSATWLTDISAAHATTR